MEKQNKFRIVTPSYNNEEWVEFNIASILNQTYTNYEVLYLCDASTDKTFERVTELVGDNPKFKLINRSENKGAMYNYSHELEEFLSHEFFPRFGGGIGMTRLARAYKLNNELVLQN